MARIVLGIEGHDVAEEVMHFLDRTGRARVVATATDDRQLFEAVRQLEPDAVVASTGLVTEPLDGRPLLALETAESVRSLRTAIRFGATGYFIWPREREALAIAASHVRRPERTSATSAPVVDGGRHDARAAGAVEEVHDLLRHLWRLDAEHDPRDLHPNP